LLKGRFPCKARDFPPEKAGKGKEERKIRNRKKSEASALSFYQS